uniref:Putative rep protein n=1 Tax=uncultured virus TaxID=340016 RepID=A0A1D8MK02_9VIRU|nr:putative rep protein [uncultured virus]
MARNTNNAICCYDFTSWCSDQDFDELKTFLKDYCKKWCFQKERAPTTGREHWQGRFSLKLKLRLLTLGTTLVNNNINMHCTPTSNENRDNMFYVTKSETRIDGPWSDLDINIPRNLTGARNWWPWQQYVMDSAAIYDDRVVDVIIDRHGNIGKTYLTAWMGVRKLARRITVQRDPRDVARSVMCGDKLPLYFIDLPRATSHQNQHTMYAAIEEIKNGYAYDDRYKFKEEYFDPPRVWVFTNTPPDKKLLSIDRWRLWQVDPFTKELQPFQERPTVEDNFVVPPAPLPVNITDIPQSQPHFVLPNGSSGMYLSLNVIR